MTANCPIEAFLPYPSDHFGLSAAFCDLPFVPRRQFSSKNSILSLQTTMAIEQRLK